MTDSSNDTTVPGGVYLCQVNDHVSCGACCGLYNVSALSGENLETMLVHRTALFQTTRRTVDGIVAFKTQIEAREDQRRPFPEFHHCPYIGLVGAGGARVGCLLHPLADGNRGVDFRGLSDYGGMACRIYFCPTHRQIPENYRKLVVSVFDHWYAYGMTITEWRLINALFRELESRLKRPLAPGDLSGNDRFRRAAAALLTLKMTWPFRSPSARGPAHYFFTDGQYPRAFIDYTRLGTIPSAYDAILVELESAFADENDLRAAEALLDRQFGRAAAAAR